MRILNFQTRQQLLNNFVFSFAEKESKAQSDDAEEVSSTSKTEPLEDKAVVEEEAEAKVEDLETPAGCDNNGATSLNDDDIIEIS